MRLSGFTLWVLLFAPVNAWAAQASDGSIKQLLAVTKAEKLIDSMRAQIDSMMNKSIQQALNGQAPNAKQQQVISKMKNRMVALLQGELSWEQLEPMSLRLYKESFTEEEVSGMLVFYKTPAGQAVINKMPLLMQKTMFEMQKMASGLVPKMQGIEQEFRAEMAAASK
jgi:hypothetical protein